MAPILNDVATDLQNPPEFSSSALNPLPEKFKAKVSNAYQTQLQALELQATKEQAFQACVKAAKEQPRWELTQEDPSKSQVEGIASTKVLKFKDDFVIRVTDTAESKVRVDMRSKSRMGKGVRVCTWRSSVSVRSCSMLQQCPSSCICLGSATHSCIWLKVFGCIAA